MLESKSVEHDGDLQRKRQAIRDPPLYITQQRKTYSESDRGSQDPVSLLKGDTEEGEWWELGNRHG